MKQNTIAIFAVLAAATLVSQSAHGAARVWGNASTDYNTSTNWNAGAGPAPGAGDVGQFSAVESVQPNLSASLSNAGLYFSGTGSSGYDVTSSSGAVAFTLTGVGATGSGGTANSSAAALRSEITSGTNTVDAPIILGAAAAATQVFFQASGGTLVVNGAVSNTNAVTLSLKGTGIIQLNGSNTSLNAAVNINDAGTTLVVGNDNALGTGTFTMASSGVLQAGGGARTLSNNIVFAGTTTISGSNAFTFNGAASTSGANSRTVTVSNTGGTTFGGSVTINGNTSPGTLVVNGSSNVAMNGTISDGAFGSSILSHSGANTLTLAHANNYSGGTNMSGGTTVSTANGAFGTGNVSLTASNVTLTLQGVTNSIADSATLNIGIIAGNTNDLVNLNYNGTETVNALFINGTQQAAGQWGAVGSGAANQSADFAGTGFVNVLTAVPEPATLMMLVLGGGLLASIQRVRSKRS